MSLDKEKRWYAAAEFMRRVLFNSRKFLHIYLINQPQANVAAWSMYKCYLESKHT